MPQAVQIETQTEQQGLAHLHGQTATQGPRRELTFDRGGDALDQCTLAVELSRERSPHLRTHSANAPGFLAAPGRDQALCSEPLADKLGCGLARQRCVQSEAGPASLG